MLIEVDDKFYMEQMRRLCREAKACNMPLEINLGGLLLNRNYPDDRFWQVAGEEGCMAIRGSDAHSVERVYDPVNEQRAADIATRYGLQLLETVDLRPIR